MAKGGFLFSTGGGSSRDFGLLILRLTFGGLIMFHGWGKLQGFLGGQASSFGDPIGLGPELSMALAIFAEFICGGLVVLGLATRPALLPLIFTMLVAIFVVHRADPFQTKELAMVYLGAYLALLFTGAGNYSVDASLGNRRRRR